MATVADDSRGRFFCAVQSENGVPNIHWLIFFRRRPLRPCPKSIVPISECQLHILFPFRRSRCEQLVLLKLPQFHVNLPPAQDLVLILEDDGQ